MPWTAIVSKRRAYVANCFKSIEEPEMKSNLSVGEVLLRLEAQIAELREKEAEHARQEEFHRGQRSQIGAELARITAYHEAFQAASEAAVKAAAQGKPVSRPEDQDAGFKPKTSRLVTRVVETVDAGARFGAGWVTQEIDRRFGHQLRRRTDPRLVAIALRRMAERGTIQQVRKGRPHWEALYSRG
jgi:hypothetical protein